MKLILALTPTSPVPVAVDGYPSRIRFMVWSLLAGTVIDMEDLETDQQREFDLNDGSYAGTAQRINESCGTVGGLAKVQFEVKDSAITMPEGAEATLSVTQA